MKIEELEEKVSLYDLARRKYNVERVGIGTYRINPCPVCGHYDHLTIYTNTNSYFSFNGCVKGGGVYKFLQEVEGLSEEAAYEELKRLAGVKAEDEKTKARAQEKKRDYTGYILDLFAKQTEEQKQYFKSRGLEHTIEKYKLCVAKTEDGLRAILPYWKDGKVVYYTARALENQEPKYKNLPGIAPLWNEEYLTTSQKGDVIIVCEGIFDALSCEELGYSAIALGGTQHLEKLFERAENTPASIFFLFDNDSAGRAAGEKAKKKGFVVFQIPEEFKDVNEMFVKDREKLKQCIEQQIRTASKPDVISIYIEELFEADMVRNIKNRKKTGFEELDEQMGGGLNSGLYIVGGIPSIGKTTFTHQLAEQMAEQGEDVLFFTLEQTKFIFVAKSLSRITAKINLEKGEINPIIKAIPSSQIMNGDISGDYLDLAKEQYKKIAERVSVIDYIKTVEGIREYVRRYIQRNNVRPIIIVDYLQILQCENNQLTDKQRIDYIITDLTEMSREFDTLFFVISSLNRANYLSPLDFESFKESGGIEYTADVVWGLQYQILSDETFKKEKPEEKRERIRNASIEHPRRVELVCLKNRFGKPYFKCLFEYYPEVDWFVEPWRVKRGIPSEVSS